MAFGIKSIETIEKGDIVIADGYMDVYDYDSEAAVDKQLIPYDTAFNGDILGFYYKEFTTEYGTRIISFLTPDAINADGSPAFKKRIYYFVLKAESYSFKANPKYDYPTSLITNIETVLPDNNELSSNWFQRNKRNLFIGFLLAVTSGVGIYLFKRKK